MFLGGGVPKQKVNPSKSALGASWGGEIMVESLAVFRVDPKDLIRACVVLPGTAGD